VHRHVNHRRHGEPPFGRQSHDRLPSSPGRFPVFIVKFYNS
jgi:hypothetical protein